MQTERAEGEMVSFSKENQGEMQYPNVTTKLRGKNDEVDIRIRNWPQPSSGERCNREVVHCYAMLYEGMFNRYDGPNFERK